LILIVRRNRYQKRVDKCKCGWCGYDLRATPDRCPECGQEPRTSEINSYG
jgi:primosomal protein N'